MGRKASVRHLTGRRKIHATSLSGFKGRIARGLPQYNSEFKGIGKKEA
jgi:hypothetical protein